MAITNKKLVKLLGLVDVFDSQEITTDTPKLNSDITLYCIKYYRYRNF